MKLVPVKQDESSYITSPLVFNISYLSKQVRSLTYNFARYTKNVSTIFQLNTLMQNTLLSSAFPDTPADHV